MSCALTQQVGGISHYTTNHLTELLPPLHMVCESFSMICNMSLIIHSSSNSLTSSQLRKFGHGVVTMVMYGDRQGDSSGPCPITLPNTRALAVCVLGRFSWWFINWIGPVNRRNQLLTVIALCGPAKITTTTLSALPGKHSHNALLPREL